MNVNKIILAMLILLMAVSCLKKEGDSDKEGITDTQSEEEVLKKLSEEEKIGNNKMEDGKYSECSILYKEYVISYEKVVEQTTNEFYSRKFSPKEKEDILNGKKELSEADASELSSAIVKNTTSAGIKGEKIDEFYEKCEGYEVK